MTESKSYPWKLYLQVGHFSCTFPDKVPVYVLHSFRKLLKGMFFRSKGSWFCKKSATTWSQCDTGICEKHWCCNAEEPSDPLQILWSCYRRILWVPWLCVLCIHSIVSWWCIVSEKRLVECWAVKNSFQFMSVNC